MSVAVQTSPGVFTDVAGISKAEYGASTVRRGTIVVPAIAANADYADQTITFSTPMPDTDYLVDLSLQGSNTHRVAFHLVANTKTVNGFTVRFTPIGIKQTTEVGVSGVADNLSYTLTVARDDTYPNLTKNTAIVDPTASLPNEWNAMQTGYLKNPMPANEATLVYTAFKLYTDTEYNNLLNNAVLTSDVTDAVTNGDMNPVTSNAVYDAISQIKTETKARYKALSFNSIPGVTFAKRDNNPKALSATRVDNIIVLNYTITIQGTYTGESNWLPIFNASQLDSLLDDDEMLNDSVTPYFCSGITYTNNASYNKLDGIMNGCYLYFYNSAVFDMGIQGQIILGIQKTS